MLVPRFVILSLLLNGAVSAQTPPIPGFPGSTGVAPEEEGVPQPMNLTQALTKPNPEAVFPGEINFRNLDGFGIAGLYQNVTGKRVLVSSTAKDAQFAFVQSAGLKNREVASLIEEYLLMEGFQLNTSLRNPNIVTLLGVNQPGGPAAVVKPVRVLDDPAQLALENGVVTYVMSFQYLKPEEAMRAFTTVYGTLRPGGTIAEVSNASSLIITEKAELIESLVRIKKRIDVPSAKVDTAWVRVEYADVQELGDQLNEMFSAQTSQNQSARVQRQQNTATPPIPGLAANAGSEAGNVGEESPPIITPDTRTNRIFLMGRPVDLVFIKELISAWDVPSDSRNFLRRKLKYLPVYEFVPVAESAIARTLGDSATGGSGSAGTSSSNASNSSLGNNNNNQNSNNNSTTGTSGSGSAASLSGSDRPTEPGSILVGKTLIVSDNVANSVIVQGPPHHVEIIEQLIDELDVKNEQVAISAVFGRYGISDDKTFGVSLGQLLNGNGIGFAANNAGGGTIIDSGVLTEFSSLVSPTSGITVGGLSGDFGMFVSALETYTNFKAFAHPTIYTTNNREARISSGTQIAIPTNTFTSGTTDSLSTNIEYRDVALELLVRPLVNSEDEVTLEISINRDTIGTDRQVGELTIPDLLSDQLETIVTVPTGSAILLGGLIEDSATESDSGVPILRSIPLLGKLFNSDDDSFGRSELVIMIQPTIVDSAVDLANYERVYDYSSNLSEDTRKQFTVPAYNPSGEDIKTRLLGTERKQQVQQAPASYPERTPNSPMQKSIQDKKKRLERERRTGPPGK